MDFMHCPRARRGIEAVDHTTLERLDWFSNCHSRESIGKIQPAKAEANSYAALDTEAIAA